MTFVSYAPNREDVLLNRVFGSLPTGRYVDVGAAHPLYASLTKAFYDRGWSGINVEPGPYFADLVAERPRDVNLEVAVSDREGKTVFYVNEGDPGTSSLLPELHPNVAPRVQRRVECIVRTTTLNRIVADHLAGETVQFLKLDVEGGEGAIVFSTDWQRFRPQLIVAEVTLPFTTERVDAAWNAHLVAQGFLEVYFDGINTWFLRSEDAALTRHFMLPVHQLDNYVIYDSEKEELRHRLAECHRRIAELENAPKPKPARGLARLWSR